MQTFTREQLLAARWHAQQFDGGAASDCDLLDFGIQDTGPDGAPWALAIRGVTNLDDLAVAWTIRSSPHYYRRSDLAQIAVAVSPYSAGDAAKRILQANKRFKDAGVDTLDALTDLAETMRTIVRKPTVKGDMSGALNNQLPDHYLHYCTPCDATHVYELTFRVAALQAGLELRAGTSPPVLQRIPGLQPNNFRHLGTEAEPRFDLIRNYLRFQGPATPKQVADFLESPVKDVRAQWPADVENVTVAGEERSALTDTIDDVANPPTPTGVRLVGPYDPLLQARDRDVLIPDADCRRAVWSALGRPGVVFDAGEPIGTWRPARSGKKLNVTLELWARTAKKTRDAISEQAARLAEFRGVDAGSVTEK